MREIEREREKEKTISVIYLPSEWIIIEHSERIWTTDRFSRFPLRLYVCIYNVANLMAGWILCLLFSVRIGLFCRARGKEVRTRVMGESKKSLWHFVTAVVLYYTMSFYSLLSLNQMQLAGQKTICWGFLGWTWIQEVAATRFVTEYIPPPKTLLFLSLIKRYAVWHLYCIWFEISNR